MQVRTEFALSARAFHRGNNAATDHKGADVRATSLFDELLHHDVHVSTAERFDHGLCRTVGIGENHTDPLRPFEQLHHHRRTTSELDHLVGNLRVMRECRDR